MGTQSEQLSREEGLQVRWLLGGVLLLLSLWPLFMQELGSGWLLVPICVGTILILLFPTLPASIPPVVWKLSGPLIIVFSTLDFLSSDSDFIDPLLRLIVLLAVLRTIGYRSRREDLQLIILCLLLIIVAGVLSISLSFAVQLLLFAPVAMFYLFLIDASACADREDSANAFLWRDFRWRHLLVRVWKALSPKTVCFAALAFVCMVGITAFLFILMPRFQFNQMIPFLKLKGTEARAGFSDHIQFGDVVDIIQDDQVAFRVDVDKPVEHITGLYWRMAVLDEYHGEGFRLSPSAASRTSITRRAAFSPSRDPDAYAHDGTKWTVYYERGISMYLPLLAQYGRVRFQREERLRFNHAVRGLSVAEIPTRVFFFQVETFGGDAPVPRSRWDRNLRFAAPIFVDFSDPDRSETIPYPMTTLVVPDGPGDRIALEDFVAEIRSDMKARSEVELRESPQAFANAAVQWLHEQHAYSLQTHIPNEGSDILVRWMRSNAAGHCELFAGAFALLARAAGYPTRLVTGFVGASRNGFEDYLIVHNRNAHAWNEVYDAATRSWFRVDPTPVSLGFAGTGALGGNTVARVDRTFGAYIDSLRVLWYRRVVQFDTDQQKELAGHLRETGWALINGLRLWISEVWKEVTDWITKPWTTARLQWFLAVVTGSIAIVMLGRWLLWMLRWFAREKGGRLGEMGRHPIRQRAGRILKRVRARCDPDDTETKVVVERLLCLRYGPGESWPDAKHVFRTARKLRRADLSSGK